MNRVLYLLKDFFQEGWLIQDKKREMLQIVSQPLRKNSQSVKLSELVQELVKMYAKAWVKFMSY